MGYCNGTEDLGVSGARKAMLVGLFQLMFRPCLISEKQNVEC